MTSPEGMFVSVGTNAPEVADQLALFGDQVDRVVAGISQSLEKIAGIDPFDKLITGVGEFDDSLGGTAGVLDSVSAALSEFADKGVINVAKVRAEIDALRASAASARNLISTGGSEQSDANLAAQARADSARAADLNANLRSAQSAGRAEVLTGDLRPQTGSHAAPDTLSSRNAEAEALMAEGYNTEAAALLRLTEAEVQLDAVRSAGLSGSEAETSALIKVATASDAVAKAQERMAAATAEANAQQEAQSAHSAMPGQIAKVGENAESQGLLAGLGRGFFGSGGGGGAGALGEQAGFIGKYILLFEGFREVKDVITDSISQTLNFERAVSDLANQLGISRDNAKQLATQLGTIGAQGGLNPSEASALGGQFATTFRGQGSPGALAKQGATIGTQLTLLTGSMDPSGDLRNATAAVQSFNLGAANTYRVLDAATSAAQNFGLANATSVLPGLAQIGDLAQQAGFSVEQTANAIADISSRTGESSDAAAGELRRFLGREGNVSFQQVFANEGINTTQPFQQELTELSAKFSTLTEQEKGFITAQFGGGRAGAAALVLLEDYGKIQDKANESTKEGGIFQAQYFERLNDVKGVLASLKSEFDNLAKDLGETGIGTGLGALLELIKPALSTVDQLVQLFNKIPAPLREAGFLLAEIVGAMQLVAKLELGSRLSTIGGRVNRAAGGGATVEAGEVGAAAAGVTVGGEAELAAAGKHAAETITESEETVAAGLETGAVTIRSASITARTTITEALESIAVNIEAASAMVAGAAVEADAATIAGGIGGAFSKAGSLLADNPLIVAAIGGVLIDATAHASERIQTDSIRAATDFVTGASPTAIQNSASKLRNQAEAARHSSGGPVGSVVNFLEGDPTGTASKAALSQANLADSEAKLATHAANAGASTADLNVSLVDLSNNQDAAATSVKNIIAAGGTAVDVAAAIVTRFQQLDVVAKGDIPQGQLATVAAGAGIGAEQSLNQGRVVARGTGTDKLINSVTDDIYKPFISGSASAVNTAVAAYFSSIGLSQDQAGSLSVSQLTQEKEVILSTLVDNAKKNGADAKQIAALMPQLNLAAAMAVHGQLRDVTGGNGPALNSHQIQQYLAQLQSNLAAETSQVANNADLSDQAGGGALAGAQASLSTLEQFKDSILRNPTLSNTLKATYTAQVNVAIQAQKLAVAQALSASDQVQASLDVSKISPFDTDSTNNVTLAGLRKQLADTKGAENRAPIQGQINQLRFQIAQQQVTDANALLSENTASDDTVGQAQDALQAAKNSLALIVSEGVTKGAQYAAAVMAVNQARAAALSAETEATNSLNESLVDPRDKIGADKAAVAADALTLSTTNRFGKNGQQTSAYSDALKQQKADQLQYVQDQQAMVNQRSIAGIDPRAVDRLAAQAVTNDKALLDNDLKGTQQYYQDLAQLHTDQQTYIQDQLALANARNDANVRSGDPLQAAHAQLEDARRTLADDLKGSAQYFTDLGKVHDAQEALATALAAQAQQKSLLHGDTTDPVEQAEASLLSAETQLNQDQKRHVGNLGADRLSVEEAQQAKQAALFNQRLTNEQNAYQLQDISTQQYLQYLELQDKSLRDQLAGMKAGSEGFQQLTDELSQIDQAIQGLNSDLEGQFNLGSIKVPSVYEVRRAITQGLGSGQVVDASTTSVTINGVDINAVINYINSILGPQATGSSSAAARRKVA